MKRDSSGSPSVLMIVQRYGLEVNGGAELYARWLAENLAPSFRIDILTTCAVDYITWANEYPPGRDQVNGLPVIRCPVDHPRDMASFNRLTRNLLDQSHSAEAEQNWLVEQGPVSESLIQYIRDHHSQYTILCFITYLYYPTVEGTRIRPSRSILIPTAHDEPAARFGIFRDLYRRVAGILYLTDAERRFVNRTYPVEGKPQELLGTGIDLPDTTMTGDDFRRKYDLRRPVLLYIGRIEKGKGCGVLMEYFRQFCERTRFDGTLVFAGRKHLDCRDHPQIRFLGFIPDDEIRPALETADVVMVPSPYESLSILLLQAFASGKPVLANGESEVLRDHCLQSNAGLFYRNSPEFHFSLRLLLDHPDFRSKLGRNGRAYIDSFYRWELVVKRFMDFLGNFHGLPSFL
ncbi:glycosyltransferase family 4 protein [bacterium]|nr:glycosyltransferase family 4 protein [candidate division CSSED10-310 bacterium]